MRERASRLAADGNLHGSISPHFTPPSFAGVPSEPVTTRGNPWTGSRRVRHPVKLTVKSLPPTEARVLLRAKNDFASDACA